jgi:hypothetical protein
MADEKIVEQTQETATQEIATQQTANTPTLNVEQGLATLLNDLLQQRMREKQITEEMAKKQQELDELNKFDPYYEPFKTLKGVDDEIVREKIAQKAKKFTKSIAINPALPIEERQRMIKDVVEAEVEEYKSYNTEQEHKVKKRRYQLTGYVHERFGTSGKERVMKNVMEMLTFDGLLPDDYGYEFFDRLPEETALKLLEKADKKDRPGEQTIQTAIDKINNRLK